MEMAEFVAKLRNLDRKYQKIDYFHLKWDGIYFIVPSISPWGRRILIVRSLKGLDDVIGTK